MKIHPTVWFTGLPSAGKSTLAAALCQAVRSIGHPAEVLDADVVRKALWPELGYDQEARDQNVLRFAHLARLLARNHVVPIVAVIAPYAETRNRIKASAEGPFIEVFVSCSLDVCIKRDVKGFYRKALDGKMDGFTGINAPYEAPETPDLVCRTDTTSIEDCIRSLLEVLDARWPK